MRMVWFSDFGFFQTSDDHRGTYNMYLPSWQEGALKAVARTYSCNACGYVDLDGTISTATMISTATSATATLSALVLRP